MPSLPPLKWAQVFPCSIAQCRSVSMASNSQLISIESTNLSANPPPVRPEQKKSLRRNTLYNLGGGLASLLTGLITVPLLIHKIGTDRFGVLAIIWLFIGYFGFFDLGLSRATANQMAQIENSEDRANVFWTALLLNAGIGTLGGLGMWLAGQFIFAHALKMSPAMSVSVGTMMPWLGAAVPIVTITGVLTGTLEGCERFLLVNSIQVFGSVLLQLLPLIVAYWRGPDLNWLIGAAILSRVANTIPMMAGVLRVIRVGHPRLPSRRWAVTLFGYGSWVTVSNIITPIFTSVDKILIGGISGLSAVTYYSVPERLARQASIFPGALARTLFPRLSSGSCETAKATGSRALVILNAALTPITVLLVMAVQPFLAHWIDPGFAARSGPVGVVVSVSIWINGLAYVPYAFLDARGRPDITAAFHLIEILPHLLLLWWALHRFGLLGGAWALVVVSTLDAILLFWKSDLRIHAMPSFWAGLGWVSLALALSPTYVELRGWYYPMLVAIFSGSFVWAFHASEDLSHFVCQGLARLRQGIR